MKEQYIKMITNLNLIKSGATSHELGSPSHYIRCQMIMGDATSNQEICSDNDQIGHLRG